MADFSCVGNMVGDPEVSFTPSGQALVKFRVAENKRVKNRDTGAWEDGPTTFWSCTAWGPHGETIAENVTRGQSVVVKGRVEIREVEKDGEKKYYTDVTVDELGLNVRWLKPKGDSSSQAPF